MTHKKIALLSLLVPTGVLCGMEYIAKETSNESTYICQIYNEAEEEVIITAVPNPFLALTKPEDMAYDGSVETRIISIPPQAKVCLATPLEVSKNKPYLILSCKIGTRLYDFQSQPFPCDSDRCIVIIKRDHKRKIKAQTSIATSDNERIK